MIKQNVPEIKAVDLIFIVVYSAIVLFIGCKVYDFILRVADHNARIEYSIK